MTIPIEIYVELIEEGTGPVYRPTYAVAEENNLYRLLPDENYAPETDETWDFAPGDLVRLEEASVRDGMKIMLARHPDPTALRVHVNSTEKDHSFFKKDYSFLRETYALPLGNNLYKLLPTPHYKDEQRWEFKPGSVVRLQEDVFAPDFKFLRVISA